MQSAEAGNLLYPRGCTDGEFVVVPLPQRQMLLCYCRECTAIWFEGPNGAVQFSSQEVRQLRLLRTRYRTGELIR